MRNKNIIIGVLVVILVALGVWLGMKFGGDDAAKASKYSMVSTINGEIYFGELRWFPHLVIKDAWALQRIPAQTQGEQDQLSIVPTSKAFWQPMGDLYLNSKNVVSWSHLRNDSDIAKALANPEAVNNQQQVPQGQTPAGTSTFQGPSGNPPSP
jgi:hypothetical protein